MWRPTVNLFVAAAGAGVLSFPYFFREAGIVLAPILFLCMAVNAAWINALFVYFADRALEDLCPGLPESSRRRRRAARELTFERMIYIKLGPLAHFLAILSVLIACCGALTAYLVLVRDQFLASLHVLCTSPDWRGTMCATIDQPAFPIFVFGLLIAFPLSCFSRLSSLGWASALSSTSLALSALCILVEAGMGGGGAGAGGGGGTLTWAGSPWQVLSVLPIAAFSLGNQFQVLPSWTEHRQDWSKAQQQGQGRGKGMHGLVRGQENAPGHPYRPFYLPLTLSTAAAYFLYSLVGGIGYAAYGAGTEGDIRLNLGGTGGHWQGVTLTARLSMVLHLALAYPVQLYPARVCLEMLAGATWRILRTSVWGVIAGAGKDKGEGGARAQATAPPRSSSASCMPTLRSLLTSLALVLGTCGLASLGQGVQNVFSIVGGLVAIVLFALPACLLWGEARKVEKEAVAQGLEGGEEPLLAPAVPLPENHLAGEGDRDRDRGDTQDSTGIGIAVGVGAESSARQIVCPPPEPRPIPSGPTALRWAAAWLFICAGGIGGLGAGLSIAQVAGYA